MIINLALAVDRSVSSTLSKENFDSWLEYFELPNAIMKVIAETKPEKRAASVRRVFQTRAPMLLDGYERYYTFPSSD